MSKETDYNSIKATNVAKVQSKEEAVEKSTQQNVRPTVTSVTHKKKGLIERLVNVTVGPDGFSRIGGYITHQVVGPMLRDMLASSAKTAIDMTFYKDGRSSGASYGGNYTQQPRTPAYTNSQTNYTSAYSQQKKARPVAPNYGPTESTISVENCLFASRKEAEDVLVYLRRQIEIFGQVPIAEYYETVGLQNDFVAQTHGWIDLSTAYVLPTNSGFSIIFPPTESL